MAIEIRGKTVVLTGKFSLLTRKQAADALEGLGAVVGGSVGAGTDLLFAGEKAGSKRKKAESLGIPILDEAALVALLAEAGGAADAAGDAAADAAGDAAADAAAGTAAATAAGAAGGVAAGAADSVAGAAASPGGVAPLREIADGEVVEVKGSARKPYQLKNTGGVYSCTCPAWRNQSVPIERRTCKHLIKVRGHAAEQARIGDPALAAPSRAAASDADKPPILLAHSWEAGQDPAGWWMSEKLDGVRAFWDGEAFLSRLGNRYLAPDWFTAGLPTTPLDGELWIARGAFQRTISVVRRHDAGEQWRQVRFLIFDAPAQEGGFEARLDWLKRTFGPGVAAYAAVVEHTPCAGLEHLRAELTRVEAAGGEGLMLRQPGSAYVEGRSSTLLKVKSFFDAEAKVVGYKAGAGRHKGRTGALLVVTPAGVEFAVGTGLSDRERESPPPVGSVITYRYQELTDGGVPRFPTYVAVRHDFEWPGDAPGDAPG